MINSNNNNNNKARKECKNSRYEVSATICDYYTTDSYSDVYYLNCPQYNTVQYHIPWTLPDRVN